MSPKRTALRHPHNPHTYLVAWEDSHFHVGHLGDLRQQRVAARRVAALARHVHAVHHLALELVELDSSAFRVLLNQIVKPRAHHAQRTPEE